MFLRWPLAPRSSGWLCGRSQPGSHLLHPQDGGDRAFSRHTHRAAWQWAGSLCPSALPQQLTGFSENIAFTRIGEELEKWFLFWKLEEINLKILGSGGRGVSTLRGSQSSAEALMSPALYLPQAQVGQSWNLTSCLTLPSPGLSTERELRLGSLV